MMIRRFLTAAIGIAAFAVLAACSQEAAVVQRPAHADENAAVEPHSPSGDHAAREGQRVSGHGTHDYVAPDIKQMRGDFELVNARTGGAFTQKDLLGSWTLLYMGYIECLEACPIAMATMPKAVDKLNALGIPTKAVFIDINAPRLDDLSGGMAHSATGKSASAEGHGSHGDSHGAVTGAGNVPVNELHLTGPDVRRQAIAKWGEKQDPDTILLSGSRKQVLTAGRLFKSRAEQTMMPTEEAIHHINHTTYVYALNPQGDVAVLLYHSDSPQMMVDEIMAASKAAPAASRT
jgi:cytochrome oxidase Cu insertion factor (SCO1/SenC/PrrC family)